MVEKKQRVLKTTAMRATRRSRRIIFLFVLITVVLLAGIAWQVWPIANIVISPKVELVRTKLEVRVDLDISEPSQATLTIPGRYLAAGEDRAKLWRQGSVVRSVNDTSFVFSPAELNGLIAAAINKTMPADFILAASPRLINEGDWLMASSARSFRSQIQVASSIYRYLPLEDWPSEVANLSVTEAVKYLSQKPGVEQVSVTFYPPFFPNPSQKLPKQESAIRFRLDIETKTPILK